MAAVFSSGFFYSSLASLCGCLSLGFSLFGIVINGVLPVLCFRSVAGFNEVLFSSLSVFFSLKGFSTDSFFASVLGYSFNLGFSKCAIGCCFSGLAGCPWYSETL